MTTSYQALLQESTNPVRRVPLTGAQEGLIVTIMSQDYIVHWLGSIPEDDSTRLVGTTMVLPYQEGDSIYNAEASTEALNNSDSIETAINNRTLHNREVFLVHRPRSPLVPLEAPDHQMNQNPIYHPLLKDTKVKLRARSKLEREGTS
jgi:hypothetical protein